MTPRPRVLLTLSGLSVVAAFALAALIAGSPPSIPAAVELCVVPALLLANAFVMSGVAWFSGDDGAGADGDGGVDKPHPNGSDGPIGGIEVDWERFESEFHAYAETYEGDLLAVGRSHRDI